MTAPRVEIDLTKITENTRCLVDRLAARRITVTGVTKAVCGHPDVARAMLKGGAVGLADARISNVLRMREAGITSQISLIRAPMQGDIDAVVQCCDCSYNTEPDTIVKLAAAAQRHGIVHDVVLMVEMGDNREGILPDNLAEVAARISEVPGITLRGIAANFACLGNVAPTAADMALLSRLADEVEGACGPYVALVSGGGSANLPWALSAAPTGRTNDLRLGEAILLGIDPVTGQAIDGLHLDAFTFVAEVIEQASSCARHRRRRETLSLHLSGWSETATDRPVRSLPSDSRTRTPVAWSFLRASSARVPRATIRSFAPPTSWPWSDPTST